MDQPSKLITVFTRPLYQAILVACMIILFTLVDFVLPHNDDFFSDATGPWIVTTAMLLCYVILNTIVALRIEPIFPYWSQSVIYYIALLVLGYAWCFLLSGKHMDEVGSFRWLWFVLTLVYMVFFAIARSMKSIVDLAIRQDKKLRGEE